VKNVAQLKRTRDPGGSENLRPSLTYAGPISESRAKISFINFVKLNFFLVIGPGRNCFGPNLFESNSVLVLDYVDSLREASYSIPCKRAVGWALALFLLSHRIHSSRRSPPCILPCWSPSLGVAVRFYR
jgi:hypothetical protein